MNILIGYILTFLYLIVILGSVTFFTKKFKLKSETSRKSIHILVGFSWFIMAHFFGSSYHLMIPPIIFTIINYISYKKDILKSMERQDKKSYGTIFYALSFAILSIITYLKPDFLPYYGIGVLTMAIGDGLAPYAGTKFPKFKIGNTKKTYAGSFIVLITALLLTISFNFYYNLNITLVKYVIVIIISPILELYEYKGSDNLTLPIGLALITYLI